MTTRAKLHADIRAHRARCRMPIEHAFVGIFENLAAQYEREPSPELLSQIVWVWDIMMQQGCEHLDTGVDDNGSLLSAISVIVRG